MVIKALALVAIAVAFIALLAFVAVLTQEVLKQLEPPLNCWSEWCMKYVEAYEWVKKFFLILVILLSIAFMVCFAVLILEEEQHQKFLVLKNYLLF